MNRELDYDELTRLRDHHPAWVLLRARNAPLIMSFLGRVFVDENQGSRTASQLVELLDDELYALNQRLGKNEFPRRAGEYLDEWASYDHGWLRKFYPPKSDEANYDLSPSVEKALLWAKDLRSREFIGTESRLNTIFELLRQMVFGADDDPQSRLAELHRRRQELDDEIDRVNKGDFSLIDDIGLRDRYQQFSRTARELLSDFREVEENFRKLDRTLREQIAAWQGSKGELLDDALGTRSSIAESDQGRSFQSFYDFLLSHRRQEELSELLERLHAIENLVGQEERLTHIHFDWIDACERTQATVRLLSNQLRRFLDDQVWTENRRVFNLLQNIERSALGLRDESQLPIRMEIDANSLTVNLPFERPLYRGTTKIEIDASPIEYGNSQFEPIDMLNQFNVDTQALLNRVLNALSRRPQVGLGELTATDPIKQGLAELVSYLALSAPGLTSTFDSDRREEISWIDGEFERVANLPRVNFRHDESTLGTAERKRDE